MNSPKDRVNKGLTLGSKEMNDIGDKVIRRAWMKKFKFHQYCALLAPSVARLYNYLNHLRLVEGLWRDWKRLVEWRSPLDARI